MCAPDGHVDTAEEVASPLFLSEFAPGVVCVLDVEEVASSLFLPELAPDVVYVLDVEWSPLFSYLSCRRSLCPRC